MYQRFIFIAIVACTGCNRHDHVEVSGDSPIQGPSTPPISEAAKLSFVFPPNTVGNLRKLTGRWLVQSIDYNESTWKMPGDANGSLPEEVHFISPDANLKPGYTGFTISATAANLTDRSGHFEATDLSNDPDFRMVSCRYSIEDSGVMTLFLRYKPARPTRPVFTELVRNVFIFKLSSHPLGVVP